MRNCLLILSLLLLSNNLYCMGQKKSRLIEQELPESVTTRPIKGSLLKETQEGNFGLVRKLVERGADVNERTSDGETHIRSGDTEQDVDLMNAKTFNRRTALHFAVFSNNTLMAKNLIKSGNSLNALDRWKYTPLHHAVSMEGREEMARLLIIKGADINAQNSHGLTPAHVAVASNLYSMLLLLLDANANCNSITNTGDTPLHMAAEMGYENMVNALIAHKANTEITNRKGKTALNIAEEMPLLKNEERDRALDSERKEKYEKIKVMLEQADNQSWFSSSWLIKGGATETVSAGLGILGSYLFKIRKS